MMTEDQLNRYEAYRRSSLNRKHMQQVNPAVPSEHGLKSIPSFSKPEVLTTMILLAVNSSCDWAKTQRQAWHAVVWGGQDVCGGACGGRYGPET